MSFQTLFDFEQRLAEYTGAPYVVVTDGCTHARDLCFRLDRITYTEFTAFTYISIPQLMHKLNITYQLQSDYWYTVGEYHFKGTNIWDSARRLEPGMYRAGQKQCVSFGHDKPLHIGRGGAIILDDRAAYDAIICMRYDGRDLNIKPWAEQKEFRVGYHYKPTPEEAVQGLALLEGLKEHCPAPKEVLYPDLRTITIKD